MINNNNCNNNNNISLNLTNEASHNIDPYVYN